MSKYLLSRIVIPLLSMSNASLVFPEQPLPSFVAFHDLGSFSAIDEGEFKLGPRDRMFLIEDQWEFDRCARFTPKLPHVDIQAESLLVIMSWDSKPRSVRSLKSAGDTLIVKVDQGMVLPTMEGFYSAPRFRIYTIPAWPGPVRFEVNGVEKFTILRGKALEARSDELSEEALRIHSGGSPTLRQMTRYYAPMWPMASEASAAEIIARNEGKYRESIGVQNLLTMVVSNLVDIRAKPALPRMFALLESMGQDDPGYEPIVKGIVGIGGLELEDDCRKALTSWNPRSCHAAMWVLTDLALPDTRQIAYERLASLDDEEARGALNLLCRLGITKEDAPAMTTALADLDELYEVPPEKRVKAAMYLCDVVDSLVFQLGKLGPGAKEALPVLERRAARQRSPNDSPENRADEAIKKIRGE
jgi:hypothetical protein